MKSKFKIMDLLREGFKLNTLKKLDGKQISVLHKKLVNEQDTTSDKTEKIKNDLAMANQSAQQLSNELGEEEKQNLDGLTARVFQHELDHLDGILFIDRIGPFAKQRAFEKAKKIQKMRKRGKEKYKARFAL